MAELIFKNKLPSADEFETLLTQAMSNANPIDDLLDLSRQLNEYEQKYRMSSEQFYQQYQAGLLDDALQHCVEWVAVYDLFMKTKRMLEAALMQAAIQLDLSELTGTPS